MTATDGGERAPSVEEILAVYEVPLVRYAFRHTHDLQAARDVVQDVFLRLLRQDMPTSRDHLAAWLYRVCRNRAIDVGRRHRRDVDLHAFGWQAAYSDRGLEACDGFDPRLVAAVAELPEAQQEALWLRFAEGLSYAEIGAVIGKSSANVGVVLHHAIVTLRRSLSEGAPDRPPTGGNAT